MMRIRLVDADRERYNLPEWITFEVGRPRLKEIRAVRQAGYKGWIELEGHLTGGEPDDRLAALAVVMWLAVRRHCAVDWDDFDLDLIGADTEPDPDPDPNP